MKITFLLTTLDSAAGTERAIITQANSLVASGADVAIHSVYRTTGTPSFPLNKKVEVSYWIDSNCSADISGQEPDSSLSEYGAMPSRVIPKQWDDQFSLLTDIVAGRILPTIESDVIVTTTPALGFLTANYASQEVVIIAQEHRATMRRGAGFVPLAQAAPKIDCIVSLTDASTDWLSTQVEHSGVRLETIPNVLPDLFRPQSTTQEKMVIAAGRLAPGKQFSHLIEAFSRVHKDNPDWILRIYGHGPLEGALKNQVVRLNLSDSVQIVPPVKNLELEWPKGSILAMSSRMEGLPLVIMEAAGAGIPTVAYDCQTGPAELIDDGVSGLLVPVNDIAALSLALGKLMADGPLRCQMGQAAKSSIASYSPSAVEAQWKKLYSELVCEAQLTPSRAERNALRFAEALKICEAASTSFDQQSDTMSGDASSELTILETSQLSYDAVLRQNTRLVEDILDEALIRVKKLSGYHGYRNVYAVPSLDRQELLTGIETISDDAVVVEMFNGSTNLAATRWQPALQAAPAALQEANVLRIYGRYSDAHDLARVGAESAVDIEIWDLDEEACDFRAPRHNRLVDTLELGDFGTPSKLQLKEDERVWSKINFPIDVVYTWVDGNDPEWKKRKTKYVLADSDAHEQATSDARFTNRDELRYSIRSIRRYAPWVRNIYLVTDDQAPEWLSAESEIQIVSHREIFPNSDCLPTFNSHAIETTLHRIPGLAEHFLYCNDDTVLLRLQSPETYFTPNGLAKFFPSPVKINYATGELEPHIAAAANNRKIISDRFDMEISQSMLHTPHPHRKSVLETIEAEQCEAVEATRRHRFRDPEDVSFLSSLGQYYGYGLEKYIPGSIRYTYIGLGREETESRLVQLLNSSRFDVATFGESNEGYDDPEETDRQLHQFFETKFSLPVPDERIEVSITQKS